MAIFWKQSNCTPRQKILVYDAVIRSKLLYGLESAELRPSDLNKMDTFQLKGLRQILKLKTTYSVKDTPQGPKPVIIRENTNKRVFTIANKLNKDEKKNAKEIIPLSEVYQQRNLLFLEKLLNAPPNDPILRTTLNPSTLTPPHIWKASDRQTKNNLGKNSVTRVLEEDQSAPCEQHG